MNPLPLKVAQKAPIFLGSGGIRAGWRLLIFVTIFLLLATLLNITLHRIPFVRAWQQAQLKGSDTAGQALVQGASLVLVITGPPRGRRRYPINQDLRAEV
jgi:hypothetical protein